MGSPTHSSHAPEKEPIMSTGEPHPQNPAPVGVPPTSAQTGTGKLQRVIYIVLAVVLLLAGAAQLYEFFTDATGKANTLVDEANGIEKEADKLLSDAEKHAKLVFTEANLSGYPATLDKYRADAEAGRDLCRKSAADYRRAADLFDEASKLHVHEKFAEYIALKSKTVRAIADERDTWGEMFAMMVDDKIADAEALIARVGDAAKKREDLTKQAEEFSKQAEVIRGENKSVFKSE